MSAPEIDKPNCGRHEHNPYCDECLRVLWVAEDQRAVSMSGPRFPQVEVELSGHDGNAFGILGRVSKALRRGGASAAEVKEYVAEATSGDYDHLLATTMRWVEVS